MTDNDRRFVICVLLDEEHAAPCVALPRARYVAFDAKGEAMHCNEIGDATAFATHEEASMELVRYLRDCTGIDVSSPDVVWARVDEVRPARYDVLTTYTNHTGKHSIRIGGATWNPDGSLTVRLEAIPMNAELIVKAPAR